VEYEDRAIAYTVAPKTIEDLLKQRRRWYRGMTQVLAKHEGMFLRKKYGIAGLYGIPFMFFDMVSPIINLFLAIFAVLTGFLTGEWTTILYGLSAYWFLQTIMVVSAVSLDREKHLSEAVMSPLMIFYNTFLDGVRIAAFAEEILSLRMRWETPKR
jgi:cellulose synthase/poly-beta-1,6-N-acetylglucosamine synthase-like glycosyltransferase